MTAASTPDPGWGVTKATFVLIFIPGGMRQLARKNGSRTNGLVQLRQIFLSFVSAGVLIGIVALLFVRGQDSGSPIIPVLVTAAVAGAALIAIRGLEPGLDCANGRALAGSYQTRMFIRIAVGELAPLAAFVCGLISGIWWIYFVGLLFALPAFWRAAPSARNISTDEDHLVGRNCVTTDIVAAFQPRPT